MAMILELGTATFELIRVTADYSNAVLVALLPYVSDVAQELDLPVPHPTTVEDVASCSVLPNRRVEAEVGIKGGWVFAFSGGYVETIQGPHSFHVLQDPDEIPKFYGEVKMSKVEAIQLARDTLGKLGIPLEAVFAEQEPQVGEPRVIGRGTVPYYYITWPDPRWGSSVEIEINGNTRRVERVQLRNRSLERPIPKVNAPAITDTATVVWPQINPQYARKLIPLVLDAVADYGQKLGLPVPRPLTTNQVARFKLEDDRNSPRVEVELTNGWRFAFNHTQVDGFYAPDELFASDASRRAIRIKPFTGKWNMTEKEAEELVRRALLKLHYPTNLVHFELEPQVQRPAVAGIPRYLFTWNYITGDGQVLQSTIMAEVDADKRELKSFYFYDQSFYNPGPKIDVPLLLPSSSRQPSSPFSMPTENGAPPRPIFNAIPPRK
jgi:hypothetical protein